MPVAVLAGAILPAANARAVTSTAADSPLSPPPLVVLIGGLSAMIPTSGGDWTFVKKRLEKEGYPVYVAATWPNARPNQNPDVIDSESGYWSASANRLDHQLVQAGHAGRPVILVGHSTGGLIARVYAKIWRGLASGCQPLGIVQLGTPNKGSKAATLKAAFGASAATRRLGNSTAMRAFNSAYPNAEGLPIYRIAGSYFPRSAYAASLTRPGLRAIWKLIFSVYHTTYNDSVVTVDSVRGGPTAGWRGCAVFKAVHANSMWLSAFRNKAGCVLPRRSGTKGAAAIDERITLKIIADIRGVEKSATPIAEPQPVAKPQPESEPIAEPDAQSVPVAQSEPVAQPKSEPVAESRGSRRGRPRRGGAVRLRRARDRRARDLRRHRPAQPPARGLLRHARLGR